MIGLLGPELESQRITVEERSKNTYENAMFLRDYVTPRTEQKWLLVTSAVHMPRAVGVFRKAGFDVEPWPISDLTDEEEAMPLKYAIHEWLGLLGYRLLGRIEEIFPAPRKSSTASNMTTATAGP